MSAAPRPGEVAYLVRHRGGDPGAVDEMVAAYAPLIFAVTVAILDDVPTSEEVTAATLAFALQNADRFDVRREPERSWLLRLARLRALQARRQRQGRRRRRRDDRDILTEIDAAPAATGEAATAASVQSAVERLRAPLREAVGLAFTSGLTASEIAARTGTSGEMASGRLRAGLLELQEAVAPAGELTL